MVKVIKNGLSYYNEHYRFGTLMYIAIILCRFAIFPVMLFGRLFEWVYYSER